MAKLEEAIKNVPMVKNYIAGKWVEPKSDLGDIVSPANCQVIARIRNSTVSFKVTSSKSKRRK